jgi:hypothetical protein
LKAQTLTEATQALKQTLVSKGLTHLNEQAGFTINGCWTDELGKTHTHFNQTINGIPVYGTDVITHADAPVNGVLRFNAAANIYAVSGQPAIAADVDARQSRQSLRSTSFDLKHVLANAALIGDIASKPALAYVYLPESGDTKLSWKVDVKYDSDNGFEHDIVFFDAPTGAELTRHPQVNYFKSVEVYDMKNQPFNSSYAPGDFLCSDWFGNSCDSGSAVEMAWCVVGVGPCPNPLDSLNVSSITAPYNYWVQCRGSLAIWKAVEQAEYYEVFFTSNLSTATSQWRKIYEGQGLYYTYSGKNMREFRLLNDGFFGIRACNSTGCGVLNKSTTPLIANHAGCPYRV